MRPQTVFWHLLACSRVNFTPWTRFWGPFRVLKCLELSSRSEKHSRWTAGVSNPTIGNQSLALTVTWQLCFVVVFRKNNKRCLFVCLKIKRTCCVVRNSAVLSERKTTPAKKRKNTFAGVEASLPCRRGVTTVQSLTWMWCNTSLVTSRHFKTRNVTQKRV